MKVRTSVALGLVLLLVLLAPDPSIGATPPLLPFDQTGDLFVLDDGSSSVLRIDAAGTVSVKVAEEEIVATTGYRAVSFDDCGIAFDGTGNMYFAVLAKGGPLIGSILKLDSAGNLGVLTTVDQITDVTGHPNDRAKPAGIAFGSDGMLYVNEQLTGSVLQMDPASGAVTLFVTEGVFQEIPGVSSVNLVSSIVGGDNVIYVASDASPNAIFAIAPTGTPTLLSGFSPYRDLDVFMTRAANGHLIIADDEKVQRAETIYRVTPQGEVTTFLTRSQLEAIAGGAVDLEGGIAFDGAGNFYVAEENTDSILKFDESLTGVVWVSDADIQAVTGIGADLRAGIAFSSQADSDSDGIPDTVECPAGPPCPDTDGDGIPDLEDPDSDNDGVPDADECPDGTSCVDSDGDGTPDYRDTDDDGDGIPTATECPGGPACRDTDGDGTPDYLDTDSDGDGIPDAEEGAGDTDGDGIRDYRDTDSDNDGILDIDECPGGPICPDTDGDGTPNFQDPDDDGDGISTATECPGGPACPDTDGDGVPNYLDPDSDNDGIPDGEEGAGDTDSDGTPDYLDDDSDNDGIPDADECPTGSMCPDSDGDGIPDFQESDSDADGVGDAVECPGGPACRDSDGDGIPDYRDADDDNDGIPTATECPGGPSCPDTDGDGTADYLDLDTDNDGIPDATECPSSGPCPDTDGDGRPDFRDSDSDGDGLADSQEWSTGPDDPLAGCISGNVVCTNNDTDGDGLPNYLDPDSDNDGVSDGDEGTGDSDGDGIPDWLDPLLIIYLPFITATSG